MSNEIMEPVDREDEPILPVGWAEGDDIFADENTWSGAGGSTNAAEEDNFFSDTAEDDTVSETSTEPAEPKEAPTTEQEPGEAEPTNAEGTEPPAEEPKEELAAEPAKPNVYRVKARIDHEDVEADIDLDKDLSAIFQKSMVTDRYQKRLAEISPLVDRLNRMATANGYGSVTEMLDAQEAYDRESAREKLLAGGTPELLVDDYLDRRYGKAKPAEQSEAKPEEPETVRTPPVKEPPARDLSAEVRELWELRPESKGKALPPEVAAAAASGKNLVRAYLEYENRQERAAAEELRKENAILKQNAASAAKAPVRGVTGGGATDTQPEDPFLKGFNAGY